MEVFPEPLSSSTCYEAFSELEASESIEQKLSACLSPYPGLPCAAWASRLETQTSQPGNVVNMSKMLS